jgi:hypothetical protein
VLSVDFLEMLHDLPAQEHIHKADDQEEWLKNAGQGDPGYLNNDP